MRVAKGTDFRSSTPDGNFFKVLLGVPSPALEGHGDPDPSCATQGHHAQKCH